MPAEDPSPEAQASLESERRNFVWMREREFYRYLEPLGLAAFPSSTNVTTEVRIPHSSTDSALTAFAQLGALRLNARRATIHLMSKDLHYTIAEATKTISLQNDGVYEEGDQLQSGCSVRPMGKMACRYILDLPQSTTDELEVRVISGDMADERFRAEVPVSDFTPRFFCSVPLRSQHGNYIGSYCVFDETPRDGLSEAHLRFLRDMSRTVTDHLELAMAKQERRRGEKAVRGIGCFVEGKTSIRDWWLATRTADQKEYLDKEEEGGMNPESAEDADQQTMSRDTVAHRQFTQDAEESAHPDASAGRRRAGTGASVETFVEGKALHQQTEQKDNLKEKMLHSTTKAMFSRAANILREAMELEGVLFLDASIGKFGGNKATLLNNDPNAAQTAASSSESERFRTGESDNAGSHSRSTSSNDDLDCAVLGFSTTDRSSINERSAAIGSSPAASYVIPEDFLKVLLRRYSLGKIFDLTADGTSSSSDSDQRPGLRSKPLGERRRRPTSTGSAASASSLDEGRAARKAQKKREMKWTHIEKLRKMFPGARSLVFFPLWDAQKERFYAGAMAWTNRPARIFTIEGELSYLAAFGNTIMAEVARLDTVKADKAKTDFIGSISHELRSPLHGILGSLELLQSSTTDAFQRNVIHTVETCSRTLLDSINHLLDFAKINNFTSSDENRATRKDLRATRPTIGRKMTSSSGMMSLTSNTDLSIVTEESVESMFASHHAFTSNSGYSVTASDIFSPPRSPNRFSNSVSKVTSILDIDRTARDWYYSAPSGAWRRVLMNLYGNALKYTDNGFINIRVKARPTPSSAASRLSILVSDSGRGMSETFQRSHMFTPFTQEDPLTPGTGLGLSLCKQIVSSLGGSLKVSSQKGRGTEIKISLTMPHASSISDPAERENASLIQEVTDAVRGAKVAFQGFESTDTLASANDSGPVKAGAVIHRAALQKLCSQWFGLEVVEQDETSEFAYLVLDSDEIAHRVVAEASAFEDPPIIVVCESPPAAMANWREERDNGVKRVVEYISQPVGPHKLARALLTCKQRASATRGDHTPRAGSSFEPFSRREGSNSPPPPMKPDKADLALRTKFLGSLPYANATGLLNGHSTTSDTSSRTSPDTPPLSDFDDARSGYTDPTIITSPTTAANSSGILVLLVDDNHINLKLLSTFMSKIHIPYATARDGQEAVDEYKRLRREGRHVHACFMDINMPIKDGMEATREIRAYEREVGGDATTVIALTGLASAAAQQEAFASGINLFLTKPVRLKEIRALLDSI